MRTTSATTHTFVERACLRPNGPRQTLTGKSFDLVITRMRKISETFPNWLGRGFFIGALLYSIIISGFWRADPAWGQNRPPQKSLSPTAINATNDAVFSDDFSSGTLSKKWVAHPAFKVQSGQLVNTSSLDAWDHFLAIPTELTSPNVVKIVYGTLSDVVGRAYTGIAILLDKADTTATGYLIFRNFGLLRLWTVVNGVPVDQIDYKDATQNAPKDKDTLSVEFTTDETGHHFRVLINGQEDAILNDPNKVVPAPLFYYAGVMINGSTLNGVDYFESQQTIDLIPPDPITTLSVISSSSTSIMLQWKATGDDGDKGTAASYDLRYSTAPIAEANFSTATKVTTVPAPSPAGTIETATVSGLTTGTTYYFAIKALDEDNNASALSNVVSASTPAVTIVTDDFNRAGPELGANWKADPDLQIVNGQVRNTATTDIWSPAVFVAAKNPSEVSIKWAPGATTFGTNWCGVLLMANRQSPTASGYMIQRFTLGNLTRLWHIIDGQFGEIVDEGATMGPTPKGGSTMRIEISSDASGHHFRVYIDGQFDRELSDAQKREGTTSPLYAGFVLESTLGAENAIDEFTAAVTIGNPAQLNKVSGDNQIGPIGQQLPDPLVVSVVDSAGNPVPKIPVKFEVASGDAVLTPPPINDNHLRLEAELAQITGPMQTVRDDNASGGKYIVYPIGQTLDATATMTFNITEPGTYYVWTRSEKLGTVAGSWFVSVDGAAKFVYDVFQGNTSTDWEWDLLSMRGNGSAGSPQFDPKTFIWNEGQHTIVFEARFEDTRLDKILITSDPTYVPQGKEEAGYITDKNGLAQTLVTFGQVAGTSTIRASHGMLTPVTFTVKATGGNASKLELTSGNNQTGAAGQILAKPLVVTVRDDKNNTVANYMVNWVVTQGNGKLSAYTSITDDNGQAQTLLTLGNQSATNRVEARVPFTTSPVIFTATTTSGVAASTSIISGNSQTATVRTNLPNPLVIKVADGGDGGVANFPVEFVVTRGGGSATASNRVANSGFEKVNTGTSIPTSWTLEGSPLTNEVQASPNAPHSGARSLNVNANRSGVGVSQTINYQANTAYTLSFYAKVVSGTMRVSWLMSQEEVIDVTAAATKGDWQLYTIYATNTTAGARNLVFKTNAAANFFLDDVKILMNTAANGQASFTWTLGDTAGQQKGQVLAMNGTTHLSGSPLNFTATAKPGVAADLKKVSGDGQAGGAGQPLAMPFVVQVLDNTGINGVPNVKVTFEVTNGGGKLTGNVNVLNVQTDNNGMAQATLTLGSQTGVQNTVQVSAAGVSNTVTFTAMAAIPGRLTKVSGPTTGSAGKKLSAPLIVRLTDSNGNRLPGFLVTFTVKQGNGTINGKTTTQLSTDTNGDAKAFLVLGPNPGAQNRVEASVMYNNQHIQGSPVSFTVTAARLKELKMVGGNNQTGTVGTVLPEKLKAKILDSLGVGIAGQNVIFKVTAGGGKLNGTDTLLTVKTDTLGIASVAWRLGPRPGTNNNKVRAETNPALTGSPLTFQASALVGAPDQLRKVSGDSSKGVVNNPLPVPFVVKVTDAEGNAIANVNVIFTVKAGGGKINGATKDTVKTQSNGNASVTLTLGNVAGSYNNAVEARAFNGSKELKNSPVTFIASATSSRAYVMNIQGGNRQKGQAGQKLPTALQVKVKDQPGNTVPDHPVRFQIVRGDGHFGVATSTTTDTTVKTDANGVARINWYLGSLIQPDSQIVQATANDGLSPLHNSPLKFVAFADPGPPSKEASFVQALPTTIPADDLTKCQVTVNIRDQFGNPIANVPVTIWVTGDGNNIRQPSELTDKDGKASGYFTTIRAETKAVTAKVLGGIDVNRGATVIVTPLEARSLITAGGNSQTGNVNTALPVPLAVKVGDKYSNGVSNREVKFKVEQGGGKLIDPVSGNHLDSLVIRSDANGLASATYILGPTKMENRIRISSSGLSNSPLLYLEQADNLPATKMIMVSGNQQQGTVGTRLADLLVVRVLDRNNRAVFEVPVNFTITLGGGLVNEQSSTTVFTDVFGEAKASWRLGPEAGLNFVRAESPGLDGSPQDFEAQANPDQASVLRPRSGLTVYGRVGSESEPLGVRVEDGLGNGVDGIGVIFELIEGTGALKNNYVVTNNGGEAWVRVIFGTQSGPRKIRASAERLSGSPIIFTAYANPMDPASMSMIGRTNNQSGTKGKPLNFPLQVKLLDALNNPVPGVQIDFVVASGGGSFSGKGSITATSDSNGVASAVWTLGASAGSNQSKANKRGGLPGSPATFTATGYENNFPIIQDVPDRRIMEGDRMSFTIAASDADNEPLTYEAKWNGGPLPPGAVFDAMLRNFSWQTDLSSAGRYELSFFARDPRGGVDEELVLIEVVNHNQPPTIERRSPRGGTFPDTLIRNPGAGGSFLMRVFATDQDGDILSYRWYRDGVFTGIFSSTYEFVYGPTPPVSQLFNVEVLVFDQQDTVRSTWVVKVPVELVSFSAAIVENQRVVLNWKTAIEQNNAGFNILRSRNQAGSYEKLNDKLIPSRRDGDYSFTDDKVEAGRRYYYKLESVDYNGRVTVHGPVMIEVLLPKTFALSQNYPNPFGRLPFNPLTHIRFELPKASVVTLSIYNTLGQEIHRLVHGHRLAGYHTVIWNGKDQDGRPVPSGIYHYRLQAGDYVATKKMVLTK